MSKDEYVFFYDSNSKYYVGAHIDSEVKDNYNLHSYAYQNDETTINYNIKKKDTFKLNLKKGNEVSFFKKNFTNITTAKIEDAGDKKNIKLDDGSNIDFICLHLTENQYRGIQASSSGSVATNNNISNMYIMDEPKFKKGDYVFIKFKDKKSNIIYYRCGVIKQIIQTADGERFELLNYDDTFMSPRKLELKEGDTIGYSHAGVIKEGKIISINKNNIVLDENISINFNDVDLSQEQYNTIKRARDAASDNADGQSADANPKIDPAATSVNVGDQSAAVGDFIKGEYVFFNFTSNNNYYRIVEIKEIADKSSFVTYSLSSMLGDTNTNRRTRLTKLTLTSGKNISYVPIPSTPFNISQEIIDASKDGIIQSFDNNAHTITLTDKTEIDFTQVVLTQAQYDDMKMANKNSDTATPVSGSLQPADANTPSPAQIVIRVVSYDNGNKWKVLPNTESMGGKGPLTKSKRPKSKRPKSKRSKSKRSNSNKTY
jgi:hypothetical protein